MIGSLLAIALQHLFPPISSAVRAILLVTGFVIALTPAALAVEPVQPDSIAMRIQELLTLARQNPRSGVIHMQLAETYRERGNLVAARASADHALSLGLDGSDSTRAVLILVDVALAQGRTYEAYHRLEELIERNRASADAMMRLSQLRWEDHFQAEALALGMTAAGRDPTDDQKRRWLAERWKEAGRPDVARTLWKSLAASDQATDEDIFQVGYLSQRIGDEYGAVEAYLSLLERSPNHPEANYNISQLLVAVGDTLAAIDHLNRAIGGDPGLQRAYMDLALLHMKANRKVEARHVLVRFRTDASPDSISDAHVREILKTLSDN